MQSLEDVNIVSRPGYFGKRRTEITLQLDHDYPGWQECWQIGNLIFNFEEAVMLYDDAYWYHLRANPDLMIWVTSFGECYDSDRSNIACGITHDPHVSPRHIQDVSVRRALLRLGVYFKQYLGKDHTLYQEKQLLHIRGPESNGYCLMPGNIKFHLPHLIEKNIKSENMPNWIKPNTVEAFWQANKVIVLPKIMLE